jgi:hypothetical protein
MGIISNDTMQKMLFRKLNNNGKLLIHALEVNNP